MLSCVDQGSETATNISLKLEDEVILERISGHREEQEKETGVTVIISSPEATCLRTSSFVNQNLSCWGCR